MVESIYPVNLGQVARVMKNFGFQNLVLVNPDVRALREAITYSAHAREVLEGAEVKHSLAEALSDAALVVGSTSKAGVSGRNVLRASVTPAPNSLKTLLAAPKRISAPWYSVGRVLG